VSNLLFNYDELVGGGDPSFAVDYMVERILETNAVYAEPTQEVIEKVDALANYKSPEDADDYIWDWLDGLAEEKGTFVYTLMFDQVWASDGSSYDLYHYDISEEDEEAIKFAGSPLEENQNLKEITTINSRELEALVDRLVDKRFKYYPHDTNYDRTIYDVFLWLEKTAGDNQRAFTFYLEKNQFGKLLSVSIFVMPGEQAYHYYDPTEEDIELLQGIGDINEAYKVNWDKNLQPKDYRNPELLADALVEAGASFIDPGFFWENIAIGVDRGYLDDDDQYTDEYYEELAQALFDAYGDDKLYYTFYYDDPYENYVMLFSDGGHIIIEDDYNWTDDDFELIAGAGMLEEAKQSSEWHEGVDWDKMYSDDIADALVKSDAVYVHPDKFEQDSLKADKFSPKYHLKNFGTVEPIVDLFGEIYDSDTLHYTIFNDPLRQYTDKFITNRGEFWNVSPDGDDWTEEDYEMVIGAGQLNETINEDFVVDSAEDFANALAEKGARYVEIPGDKMADFQQISNKNPLDADDDVHELIYEFLMEKYKTGDSLVYTYYDYDGTIHTFDGNIGDHYWVDDFKDVPYNYGIELIIGAGQLNELKELNEESLDEIELADLLDHITKNGLKVREFDEIEELEEIAAEYWDEDYEDFNDEDPDFYENLKTRFSLSANEGEMVIFYTPDWYYNLPFVGKLGDDTLWTYDSIKGFQDLSPVSQEDMDDILEAGSLFQESLADQPTYVKIEALANDVVEQDLQYYELSNDEREDLIELAAMIGDGEEPIAKWDKTIINILKNQRSKTGKEHYTVTPTMTQIQYPDEQVIDYMYFDEFLTRFLPNADKSDLELLRGAGQLNEIESPKGKFGNWWSEVDWNSPTKGEQLADVLASIGAEYIPEGKWNTLDKDKYLDNGDLDGYISDVAYDFKIHSYDKPHLTFSLVEIGDEVYLISSTEFTYDMWDFDNEEIDLIIGAGQLNEYDTNWDQDLDFNTETSAEDVAERLVKIGAKYVEVTTDIEPKSSYHETFRDYLDDMAELFSEKYGHRDELYFTYAVDDDAFVFSDGTYWFDENGFPSDDVDLVIDAGKLNEETASSNPFIESDFVSAEAIADKLADLGAEYIDLDSDEIEDIEEGDVDDRDYEAFKIVKYYSKRKGRPVFLYSAYDGVFHFYDENSGTHEIFYEADFRDVMGQEAIDLIIGAGRLNEESKEYIDPLASITDASKGEQLADALANAGARYIDAEWLDKIEHNYVEGKYPKFQDSVEDIIDELRDEFKKEDTIIFTYFQPERVFITYDGKYYETFFMSDFDDLSGTADVRMIIDAGLINEALDLEDPKIGDMIDAYTYDIYALIDPKGYNQGNIRELSSDTMYKYEDEQNPADYYMENSWKTLPKPISDQLEDILGSSWMQDRASDYARDAFFENNKEAYNEFYGMHDEVDEDLLRDAGYDKWAEQFEQEKDGQIASFLEDDYEIKFGASIKTDFDRDPESIFVYIYCVFNDFSAGETLKEVELGKVYKNIDSVEALKEAMKEFMYDLLPKFMEGEKPAKITTNDVYEQQKKKPLKEGVFEFEDLITNIVEWPLHYVDPPQDILDSIANEAEQYGMDMSEVETELWERLSKYLGTLDRNAGYADEEGYESDEGFFTIIDSDFWEDAGFTPNPDMYFYIDANFSDGYELTPEQYKDVIDAGKLYDNDKSLNENKDTLIPEDVEYNPTFEQIDEMIENATEELIYGVSRTFDSHGDPTIEKLESGEGFISFADGGFRSHETSNVANLYGQYAMPTNEIDDALEKIYDRVFEYAHEAAVEWMKKENPEVWAEFSGDPELLTYKNLYDAGEAYEDVDEKRSKIYYDAAEELDQYERDSMYEDDDSMLFFEIEIQYYNANATLNDTDLPMLKFRGAVESNYKALGAKETERTFTSEEELEEALTSGAKEIEDWFDGEERNQNRVGQLTEELSPESSLEIFNIVKSIVEDNTRYPLFENPIAEKEIDQDVGIYSYAIYEDYYIDLMKYLSNERVLPRDFQKNEEQYVEERIWEAAEDEVLGNLDEYVPYEKSMEIKGVHHEIAELYRNGELQDIDLEFYEDLHDIIVDKNSDYMNDTGVMQHFEFTVVPEEELVTLIAKVELDPQYDAIEHKKSKEIKIESDLDEFAKKVDQATKELVSWMQGN
jgi:hypothetical protein